MILPLEVLFQNMSTNRTIVLTPELEKELEQLRAEHLKIQMAKERKALNYKKANLKNKICRQYFQKFFESKATEDDKTKLKNIIEAEYKTAGLL